MKAFVKVAVLIAGLTGAAGSAMADKTWTSDPSTYPPDRTQMNAFDVLPLPVEEVEPSYAPSKAYRLYKAPKAHPKSQQKAAR